MVYIPFKKNKNGRILYMKFTPAPVVLRLQTLRTLVQMQMINKNVRAGRAICIHLPTSPALGIL